MKLLVPLALLLAVLVGAAFWDRSTTDADIVFVNGGDVYTLDPQRMSYVQDFRLAYALYEGLLRWNNRDLTIEPAAADLPTISDDRLTYTFQIFRSAKWSNGDPVTAHDFVYSWQRLLWPDTAADYSSLFFVVEGAEDFFRWRGQQLAMNISGSGDVQELLNEAEQRFGSTVGVKALDDRTLQIRLARPTPYFLDLLCFAVASPVHRPTVEGWPSTLTKGPDFGDQGWMAMKSPSWNERKYIKLNDQTGCIEQRHEWARPKTLVSNGPYILSQWRYKRDMRLERNPHFHSPQLLKNNSVLILAIEDANTAVLAYESGKIDWLGDVAVEYQADMLSQRLHYEDINRDEIHKMVLAGSTIDEVLASLPEPQTGERRNIHARPTFGTDFFSFNCRATLSDGRANPFADARVRRAFALATDKRAIVLHATRLDEPTMNTLVPPGSIPGYTSPAGLDHNPQKARDELANAGWTIREGILQNVRGEHFPIVDLLWTTGSSRYKWMSLELKSQWERELSVRVELRGADTKFYKEDLKLGKFMIARGRWYGDYGDPTTFLDINKTGDGNNDRAYSNAAYDAMLDAAAAELDPAQRFLLLKQAEAILFGGEGEVGEMPLLPICQLVQLYMYEPGRLKGLSAHPRLIQYLWQLEANSSIN